MINYNFYDTSSLLLKANDLFEEEENIVISSITLEELEGIKISSHKDEEIKANARRVLQLLDKYPQKYQVVIYRDNMFFPVQEKGFSQSNDTKILASAIDFEIYHPDEVIFITNDLSLKVKANLFFGADSISSVDENKKDEYMGFKEIVLSEDEICELYDHSMEVENRHNLKTNEYLIVKDFENNIIDKVCWTGNGYRPLKYQNFNSRQFGNVKPYSGDPYQALAADSLINNQITMLKGKPGSGKTTLALGYLFYLLEKNKIDKIIVFCNTVATKGSARLGFYPGTRDEKLLDSQIGNLLSSKLGDKMEVERMINEGKLVLLPLSDIRGYDTNGMNAGVYISEAQNLDVSLMKLALQRIGEDSVCIIDGDARAQVDDISFAGSNNGMRRASKVFRGTNVYGEVELLQIHRSRIANIAERM